VSHLVVSLVLAAHLLLVDLAMAGPLLAVGLEWHARRRGDVDAQELARQLALASFVALVVGGVLGAVLLAVYVGTDAGYWPALASLPEGRWWFSIVEFAFGFACLMLYVALWRRLADHRIWHRLLALAGTTNLLVHFPPLFAIVALVRGRLATPAAALDNAAYRRLLVEPEVLSRVAHVWLAAAAVAGVTLLALAARRAGGDDRFAGCARLGARVALAATMLQFPVGLWVAIAMSEPSRARLLGGDAAATLLFLASLVMAMLLLHVLSAAALADAPRRRAAGSCAALAAVVVLMSGTLVRLQARQPEAGSGAGGRVALALGACRGSIGSMPTPAARSFAIERHGP
jgi:hypothetical protein